jgi:gluconolactonase
MPRIYFSLVVSLLIGAPTARAQDMALSSVLIDGEGWKLVSEGYGFTEGPAADKGGNVYFVDVPASTIFRIDAANWKVTTFAENTGKASGLAFGPDGKLYACQMEAKQVVSYDARGKPTVLAKDLGVNDLTVDRDGGVYVTDMGEQKVWYVPQRGKKKVVAETFQPNGLTLWPDGKTLVVADWQQPHLWTYRVGKAGELNSGERYYSPLQVPPSEKMPGSDGMTVDDIGRLYVCTHAGLQMFDPTGRPCGAIAKPQRKFLSNVEFGGKDFDTLFVTCSDKVFARKVNTKGTPLAAKSQVNQ